MSNNNLIPISMGISIFNGVKGDLTQAIQKCLTEMEKAGSDTGKVTLGISIVLDKVPVTTEQDYREADVPKFKWKAESNVPLKTAFDGEFGGDYELAKDGSKYCLKQLGGQMSVFDMDDENDEEETDDEE